MSVKYWLFTDSQYAEHRLKAICDSIEDASKLCEKLERRYDGFELLTVNDNVPTENRYRNTSSGKWELETDFDYRSEYPNC